MFRKYSLCIDQKLIDLSTPKVMGILNITPDSFYEGSRVETDKKLLQKAGQMLSEGADFLEVGGYSSRPNATDVPLKTELNRVVHAVELIKKHFSDALIVVDTFRATVGKQAVDAGANMINDISGGYLDKSMLMTVAKLNVPYMAMHMRGTPQTMQHLSQYDDILHEMIKYFSNIISRCNQLGINDVIIDPGIGFAKTMDQNFFILKNLELFSNLCKPILIGVSRKSLIYKTLNIDPSEALNGTSILNTFALIKGIHILRVHDVKEAKQVIGIYNKMIN